MYWLFGKQPTFDAIAGELAKLNNVLYGMQIQIKRLTDTHSYHNHKIGTIMATLDQILALEMDEADKIAEIKTFVADIKAKLDEALKANALDQAKIDEIFAKASDNLKAVDDIDAPAFEPSNQ